MASEYDTPISHRLNISAKNISRELGEADISRGRDRPHSIGLLRKHIVWSFCGDNLMTSGDLKLAFRGT